jgi:hypothetical protein
MKKLMKYVLPIFAVLVILNGCGGGGGGGNGNNVVPKPEDKKPVTGITVSVEGAADSIEPGGELYLAIDEELTLKVALLPSNITGTVTWTLSEDWSDVLDIDVAGDKLSAVLTGVDEGEVEITVSARNNDNTAPVTFTFTIEVVPVTAMPVQSVTIKDSNDVVIPHDGSIDLFVGESIALTAELGYGEVTGTVNWTQNDSVAVISPASGLNVTVTGSTAGTSTITVSAQNENNTSKNIPPATMSFTVTVLQTAPPPLVWTEKAWTGESWTGKTIYALAWGNGKFVAGGDDGKVLYAAEDMVWTVLPTVLNARVAGIAFGSGYFVAGTYGAAAAQNLHRSTDGISWTAMSQQISGIMSVSPAGERGFAAGGSYNENNSRAFTSNITAATPIWNMSQTEGADDPDRFTGIVRGLAWGNGRLVAVGDSGKIAYSTDNGTTWTGAPSGVATSVNLLEVAFGRGKFVAVGAGGTMIYSTDGAVWTEITDKGGISGSVPAITYDSGYFVALDSNGKAAYSTDGITWTASTTPPNSSIQAVAFGGDKWVAVGGNGKIYYSGGESSVKHPLISLAVSASDPIGDIAENANITVKEWDAGANDGNKITLTAAINPSGKPGQSITWTVAAADTGKVLITPAGDGLTAELKGVTVGGPYNVTVTAQNNDNTAPLTRHFTVSVISAAELLPVTSIVVKYGANPVTIMDGGSIVLNVSETKALSVSAFDKYDSPVGGADVNCVSATGSSVTITNPATLTPSLVGGATGDTSSVITVSARNADNGGTWKTFTFTANVIRAPSAGWTAVANAGAGSSIQGIAYGNGVWVVGSNPSSGVKYSDDNGSSWKTVTGHSGTVRGLAYVNDRFFAGGDGGLFSSTDGETWASSVAGAAAYSSFSYGVVNGNGKYIYTVGGGSTISSSDNGTTWTASAATGGVKWGSTFGGGKFVVVGAGTSGVGNIAYSTNGTTWNQVTMPSTHTGSTFRDVAYGNGIFVAVHNDGTAIYSYDAETWTAMPGATIISGNSIAFANGYFVIINNSTTIRYSSDGLNWSTATLAGFALAAGSGGNVDFDPVTKRWGIAGGTNVSFCPVAP